MRDPVDADGQPMPAATQTPRSLGTPNAASPWLTYAEAAAYCGWSVAYLRNLVCAEQIPVYGKPRVRRFRRDMLDRFLTDPDAAMRLFRAERNTHGG
jgi:excisionase family DNA binding protein